MNNLHGCVLPRLDAELIPQRRDLLVTRTSKCTSMPTHANREGSILPISFDIIAALAEGFVDRQVSGSMHPEVSWTSLGRILEVGRTVTPPWTAWSNLGSRSCIYCSLDVLLPNAMLS